MRVIQTRNDTIRLIFNPKTDGLCLSDFLIVRDGRDNFLGQIVEIYDDKFNQEENVASIRLVYRILPDHQVVPYDNFTPSRECEIAKIKLEEIEKCLNTDKDTVPFGISTKNNKIVNINLNFFNNNPVIFADKLNEVNCAFENAAQKLKSFKKVVVIDYTGTLNIKNAKRIKAKADFKLPLDFYSLEYIWQKATSRASLEAQAELEDMFVELQKFVSSTEDKYIPFPRFVKVIEQQYKATPAIELKLFLNSLRRYWHEELFARSKKEFQGISKALQKEDVVIVDLSNLRLEWHREFLEFAIRQVRDYEAYLLLRLNENNSNPEMINDLYLKNPKLSIISSISYGFVKLPHIMEYAKNYILYKTLNPRRDFGFANFQVAALNSSSFLMFGEDTRDFMFVLKNYVFDEEDLNKEEDKKVYIDLNLELEDMKPVELAGKNFELKNVHIQKSKKQRLADEIALEDVFNEAYNENQAARDVNEEDNQNFDEENIQENAGFIAETPDTIDDEQTFKDIPLVIEDRPALESAAEADINESPAVLEAQLRAEITETEEILPVLSETVENIIEEPDETETTELLPDDSEQSLTSDEPDTVQIDAAGVIEVKEDIEILADNATEPTEEAQVTETESDDMAEDEDSKMAELIEASLKNDEDYMKELQSQDEETPDDSGSDSTEVPCVQETSVEADNAVIVETADIPLAEEDLDYFISPSDDETISGEEENEESVITSEMIEKAASQEELTDKIEAKTDKESEKESLIENIKKNSLEEANDADGNAATEANFKEKPDTLEDNAQDNILDNASLVEEPIDTESTENFDTALHQLKEEAQNVLLNEESIKTEKENAEQSEASVLVSEIDVDNKALAAQSAIPAAETTKPLSIQTEPEMLKTDLSVEEDIKQKNVDSFPAQEVSETLSATEKLPDEAVNDTTDNTDKIIESKNNASDSVVSGEEKKMLPNDNNILEPITSKQANPDEAIIIVKEKPNLLIEDFTEEAIESKADNNEDSPMDAKEDVSLRELAQKAIDERFNEVIEEGQRSAGSGKNKLQINENVSIDLDKIKNNINGAETSLPIFKNNDEETQEAEYNFAEGMRVSHEKYGEGNILKVVKYSNRCLLQIEFENMGKRLLDPKIAKIKPV